ncbi:DUF2399 domain-containing protein [Lentzea kentuckyensis]|uniref:DUF2399 domain-containing protein n=1 Tax=Lentzea kentuckyensis TaxID=360086 RepID=UPI000A3A5E0B|nr:DUF2399 domain-containing protein [Lentzea kentuckyensis]
MLRAAASELADRSATLVCTEGQPSAACHRLLAAARGQVHWRGDFDWTGLRTTAAATARYEALPWRMTVDEYMSAGNRGLRVAEGATCRLAVGRRAGQRHGEQLIPRLLEDPVT